MTATLTRGGLIANPDDGDHPDDPLQKQERPSQPHAPSKPPSTAPSNATTAAAPRGGDAQGNVKVWIRHDAAAKAIRTTLSNGPPWSAVVRRVTEDARTHKVLADEKVSGDEPDYHDRWYSPVPDGPRDIITERHYVEPPGATVPIKHLL